MFEFPCVAWRYPSCFLVRQSVYLQKNNLPFQSILCLLHAFQKKFKLSLVSRERNDREPNGEVYEVWVLRDIFGILSWVSQSATLWSINDNITFLSKLSWLYAFQANFKHWYVYREWNDREPMGEVWKILVSCEPVRVRKCRRLRCSP